MKQIIKDTERGLLFRNGVYTKMLGPGRHRIHPRLRGEAVSIVTARGVIDPKNFALDAMLRDPAFAKDTAVVSVPANSIGLVYADGVFDGTATAGKHVYWDTEHNITFEVVDMSDPGTAGNLPVTVISKIAASVLESNIPAGQTGLLFYDNVLQRQLEPGRYFFWTAVRKVLVQTVDLRLQQLDLSGQEILTADKVSLRVNFTCAYRVTDPVKLLSEVRDCTDRIHTTAQLALREFCGKYRFDDLLRQKDSIGGVVLERLRAQQDELFVEITDAGIRDIILPGEIRDIMNTVLVAEKSAQASVISRREEIAATRSLLDTAKLMDENATLFKLKEMEYLEKICDKVGSISVDGAGGVLAGLRELVSGKK